MAALAALRPPEDGVAPVKAREEALDYLATTRAWLGDAAAWQAAADRVARGMVEREVAPVSNPRRKRQGLRWRRATAAAVVARRARQDNAAWDAAPADLPRTA